MSMILAGASGVGPNRRRDKPPSASRSRTNPEKRNATATTKGPRSTGADQATMAVLACLMEGEKMGQNGKRKMGTSEREEKADGKEKKKGFLQRRVEDFMTKERKQSPFWRPFG